MTDKQQAKTNTAQKAQDKKLSQLQPLSLKHLDSLAGGATFSDPFGGGYVKTL
jgi:hypothetical protein